MKLEELVALASEAYPEDLVRRAHVQGDAPCVGDLLARFIAEELVETYQERSDDEQLEEAISALESARTNLDGLIGALEDRRWAPREDDDVPDMTAARS